MSFFWSLFGFQQAGVGPLADGSRGDLIQDAAITLHLPAQPQYDQRPDPNNPGQTVQVETFGSRLARYARMILGGIGYINTSNGGGLDDRIHTMIGGPLENGAHPLPVLMYTGLRTQTHPGLPPVPPAAPPAPPGAPLGGGFPGQYVGRIEREGRAFRY